MARIREVEKSRRIVVEWFLTRRSLASMDGSVYTDGSTLCAGYHHVAFWHQGTIYLVDIGCPESLVKDVQAMVRLGNHDHKVVEGRVSSG